MGRECNCHNQNICFEEHAQTSSLRSRSRCLTLFVQKTCWTFLILERNLMALERLLFHLCMLRYVVFVFVSVYVCLSFCVCVCLSLCLCSSFACSVCLLSLCSSFVSACMCLSFVFVCVFICLQCVRECVFVFCICLPVCSFSFYLPACVFSMCVRRRVCMSVSRHKAHTPQQTQSSPGSHH